MKPIYTVKYWNTRGIEEVIPESISDSGIAGIGWNIRYHPNEYFWSKDDAIEYVLNAIKKKQITLEKQLNKLLFLEKELRET